MSYYRKCEDCGCTLDPGEGRICDECAEKMRQKTDRRAVLRKMITLEIAHVSSGGYFKNIVFDKAYYKGVAANSSTKPYNGSCVPLRIYGIRK